MEKILNFFGYVKKPTYTLNEAIEIIFYNHPAKIKNLSDLGKYINCAEDNFDLMIDMLDKEFYGNTKK